MGARTARQAAVQLEAFAPPELFPAELAPAELASAVLADAPLGLKPPLKWAGGKRWQVPLLRELWAPHRHRRLVEPFCGGLAVALGLRPARALLNDVNPHLINFYRWVRRGLSIHVPMQNNADLFYAQRKRFNELLAAKQEQSEEAASIFYYMNRTCFNGLCRFNRSGFFNVPFGRYASIDYKWSFDEYQPTLRAWALSSGDFAACQLDSDDFVYADPPYDVEFTAYSAGGFGWSDQQRLAELLARHPGPVVLVNQATPRIEELYRDLGYALRYLSAPRRISCDGDRTAATEVMGLRNL
jgi:DNA adenine methylase